MLFDNSATPLACLVLPLSANEIEETLNAASDLDTKAVVNRTLRTFLSSTRIYF